MTNANSLGCSVIHSFALSVGLSILPSFRHSVFGLAKTTLSLRNKRMSEPTDRRTNILSLTATTVNTLRQLSHVVGVGLVHPHEVHSQPLTFNEGRQEAAEVATTALPSKCALQSSAIKVLKIATTLSILIHSSATDHLLVHLFSSWGGWVRWCLRLAQ